MNYEIWKDVLGFENKYQISNTGKLKNKITNRILKNTNKNNDYLRYILYNKTTKKTVYIHRLVAQAFIPNPHGFLEVNHIDGNKQNNCVENLEWCNRNYNIQHALKNGLNSMDTLNNINKNRFFNKYGRLYQYDKNKKLVAIYNSPKEAHEITGVCIRNILQCINHEPRRKTAGGFIWLSEMEVVNNEL